MLNQSYFRLPYGLRAKGLDDDTDELDYSDPTDEDFRLENSAIELRGQWSAACEQAQSVEELQDLANTMYHLCSSQVVLSKSETMVRTKSEAMVYDYTQESGMLRRLSGVADKQLGGLLAEEATLRQELCSGGLAKGLNAAKAGFADLRHRTDESKVCKGMEALLQDYISFVDDISQTAQIENISQTAQLREVLLQSVCTLSAMKLEESAFFADKPEHGEWLKTLQTGCVDDAMLELRAALDGMRFEGAQNAALSHPLSPVGGTPDRSSKCASIDIRDMLAGSDVPDQLASRSSGGESVPASQQIDRSREGIPDVETYNLSPGKWMSAKVTTVHDDETYDIHFDAGGNERKVERVWIQRKVHAGGTAR
jgi:hypothetical protein